MHLCPQCRATRWPFLVVTFLAGIAGFLTWIITGMSYLTAGQRIAAGLVVAAAVGGTLAHYVLSCMRRHCRHERRFGPHNQQEQRPGHLAKG